MDRQITAAQIRMSDEMNFTFLGSGAANEAGHVANMTNQLRMVLFDIRTTALAFQSDHGVTELRRCPHCGLVWDKIEGCDGDTVCGEIPSSKIDVRNSNFAVLATFTFDFEGGQLRIRKSGQRDLRREAGGSARRGVGCGRTINWKHMASVSVPSEFRAAERRVTTEDVSLLPRRADNFRDQLGNLISSVGQRLNLGAN